MRGTRVEKAVRVAVEKRVKQHIFRPSMREIWTVVGKDWEYWVDPDDDYCSCQDYYFKTLSGKERCYHLQVTDIARQKKLVEVVEFSDEEYEQFLRALVEDMLLSVRNA